MSASRSTGRVGAETWQVLVTGGDAYSIQGGPNRTDRVVLSFDDCPASLEAFEAAVDGAKSLLRPSGPR